MDAVKCLKLVVDDTLKGADRKMEERGRWARRVTGCSFDFESAKKVRAVKAPAACLFSSPARGLQTYTQDFSLLGFGKS